MTELSPYDMLHAAHLNSDQIIEGLTIDDGDPNTWFQAQRTDVA
jgi:hypothetical protein